MNSETHSIDLVIDHVARRMTTGEPTQGLRHAVMTRLDDRPRVVRRLLLVPVAAAIAVVAIVVATTVRIGNAPGKPAELGLRPATTASSIISRPSPAAVSDPAADRLTTRARRQSAATHPSAEELAWRARAIPVLEPIDPLRLDGIQPAALAIPLLQIAPLTTPPISPSGDGSGR